MSQLTITSYYVRRGIKLGIIGLLSFFILRTGFGIFMAYWRKLHPPSQPPPEAAYGKLPDINFPDQKTSVPINFQLETVEGGLPTDLGDRAKVVYLSKFGGKFRKLDDAQQIAKNLNLSTNGQKLTENLYKFTNPTAKIELEINVLTQNFIYAYDYIHDQTLINPPPLPNTSEAVKIAESFLKQIGKLTTELEEGNNEVSYWSIKGEKLVPAISASEADFIRVNLFRKNVDEEKPIMPPTYPESLVSILITSRSVQNKQVVEAKYTHFESDRQEFSEYPILPIETAWEEVKSGNYFLASFDGNSQDGVKIRKIYLGYYDPLQPTSFLQPIYVFEGDENFMGYYPAIPPEWKE